MFEILFGLGMVITDNLQSNPQHFQYSSNMHISFNPHAGKGIEFQRKLPPTDLISSQSLSQLQAIHQYWTHCLLYKTHRTFSKRYSRILSLSEHNKHTKLHSQFRKN